MANLTQVPPDGEIRVRATDAQLRTLERVRKVFGIDLEAAARLALTEGCLRARGLLSRREQGAAPDGAR